MLEQKMEKNAISFELLTLKIDKFLYLYLKNYLIIK